MTDPCQQSLGQALMDACVDAVMRGETHLTWDVSEAHLIARVLMYGEDWMRV